jgi:hypothetical protein
LAEVILPVFPLRRARLNACTTSGEYCRPFCARTSSIARRDGHFGTKAVRGTYLRPLSRSAQGRAPRHATQPVSTGRPGPSASSSSREANTGLWRARAGRAIRERERQRLSELLALLSVRLLPVWVQVLLPGRDARASARIRSRPISALSSSSAAARSRSAGIRSGPFFAGRIA